MIDFGQERPGEYEKRLSVCLILVVVFFLLVFFRLFFLQVVRGRHYSLFSMEQTIKEIRIPPMRGMIADRNRLTIVESRASFDLVMIPQHLMKDREKVRETLRKIVGLDAGQFEARWREVSRLPGFLPYPIAADIPYDHVARIRALKSIQEVDLAEGEGDDPIDLRGIEIVSRPLRRYPQGPLAAATIGYIGRISPKDFEKVQKAEPGRYVPGDLIGIAGLERYRERDLRGQTGYKRKIVDAVGREIKDEEMESSLREEEPIPGDPLILSLDSGLQRFAEERFRGKTGALVALDPGTGEILAMVSLPAYDPSELVSNVSHRYWSTLVSDPRNLLLNRAIQGVYPPGSTFKVVTAIAGLEEGIIRPDEKLFCGGGFRFGNRFFRCWKKEGHGAISVHRAIAESCDAFFYQLGLRLGVDRIAKYARLLGLGETTGVDLEGEKPGTIPTTAWKKRVFRQEWQEGENLSIAVGQGYDTVTPIQNALMVARVATGKKIRPHLVRTSEREVPGEALPISRSTLDLVRAAMKDTLASSAGTAHGSFSPMVTMAGKTGTAQVISEEGKRAAQGLNTADHAWFVAYAPADKPGIAVSVLVEHGGFGASAAAPIAKEVIEKFLISSRESSGSPPAIPHPDPEGSSPE